MIVTILELLSFSFGSPFSIILLLGDLRLEQLWLTSRIVWYKFLHIYNFFTVHSLKVKFVHHRQADRVGVEDWVHFSNIEKVIKCWISNEKKKLTVVSQKFCRSTRTLVSQVTAGCICETCAPNVNTHISKTNKRFRGFRTMPFPLWSLSDWVCNL